MTHDYQLDWWALASRATPWWNPADSPAEVCILAGHGLHTRGDEREADWGDVKPDWWPEWMGPPPLMGDGHVRSLGDCLECGATQYPMSYRESHFTMCSRYESAFRGTSRKIPWPADWHWR